MISVTGVAKALLVSAALALSAYAVAKINLFGLESASDRMADQVYQRITAADYGKDRRGQRAVRVVYLDESSIENMKGYGWTRFPPTYDQQWTMLDDLMTVGGAPPSALYVDFVYMGQGGTADGFPTFLAGVAAATHARAWADKPGCLADPLIRIACVIAAGGTPIVLAKPSPADLDLFTDVQRRLDAVAILAPAMVRVDAYPLIVDYRFDKAKAARLGVHRFDISPAMALYTAWCLRRSDRCGEPVFGTLAARARAALAGKPVAAPDLARVFDAPVDVVWGSRPDPDYLAVTRAVTGAPAPCRGQASGWRARLVEQLAGLRGPAAGARQECPYIYSLGYDRLVLGEGLGRRDLTGLLAGKMVLVGGHFRASNDWVDSPVHGQVPGVHFHAMALDNLIEAGDDYRRNANAFLDSDLLKSVMIFALAFCGVMGVMARNSLLDRAQGENPEPRLRARVYAPLYLLLFSASIGVVVLATWLGVAYLHRSPINWIGLCGVAIGFLFYATRQTLPADVGGSMENVRFARRIVRLRRRVIALLKFEEERLVGPRRARPSRQTADSAAEGPTHVQDQEPDDVGPERSDV